MTPPPSSEARTLRRRALSILAALLGASSVVVGCLSEDPVQPARDAGGPDATVTPVVDAGGRDATVPVDAAPDARDAASTPDARDAADAGVDADATTTSDASDAADAQGLDASDATLPDASDASDAAPEPEDAFSFPDAHSLNGLRIAFLGNPGNASEASLSTYLTTAATITRIDTAAAPINPLTAATFASYDVVVFDQLVRSYSQAEADVLATWVAGGGGVLSLTGYSGAGPDGRHPNSLLASVGLQYVVGTIYSNSMATPLVPHPVMNGVAYLNFYGGYPVTSSGLDGGVETTLSMIDGTHAALMAREHGAGRVLLWGDEWIVYDSEFVGNQGTQRFWNNAMLWLTHR